MKPLRETLSDWWMVLLALALVGTILFLVCSFIWWVTSFHWVAFLLVTLDLLWSAGRAAR